MSLMVKDRPFYKNFFSLTLVIALQNVIVFGVNLADNIMIGSFSEASLSGVALANQIQFFLQMLTMGIGEAIVTLSAQYWGKKQNEPIQRIVSIGLRIGIIGSALLWAAVFFFPHQVLGIFTPDWEVILEGTKYVRIMCFTYVIFCITNILISALRSVETVKIGFYVSLSTLFVNVFLNYCLIFGNFGFPRLGVEGAAIATLVARIIEFLIVVCYFLFWDKKIHFRLQQLIHLDVVLFKDFIRIGIPVIVTNALWGIAMGVQTAVLGHLGSSSIAANSIATTVFQILTVVSYGASNAAAVIVGKTIGENRIDDVKRYAKTMQVLFLIIGVCTGLLLFASKNLILSFYNVSAETKVLASQFINVLCVTVVGTAYQVACIGGIIRGGGNTKLNMYNDMFHTWVIVTPLSLLAAFVFNWPPVVVFICLKCDQVLKCIVAAIKVNDYKWIRQITRETVPAQTEE